MRRRFILGMKNTQNRAPQCPREKGPLARGRECANPSWSHRSLIPFSRPPCFWASLSFLAVPSSSWPSPPLPGRPSFFLRSLLLYIIIFCSSSSYTCQSSMPILECTFHQPFFLALCKLLWPPSHCPGVTSTLMVLECQL